ncbi:flagellar biosynthesis protein FliQ [Thermosediminibacter oceani]|uniref:Flagellar biosynthetic protein FliQ n=1 Tax=Thermosediminibacter oceani (strain ATCC BAA-1034 / DSM 16646 / JW/IW-1228P) TaxID=555079 RepID=D9S398_THEOJ|nr:flagellar biosynthesis protein FliQ [Thermosediminibacter oceani]ADL07875.1 flagellar biosynthetic protein FliQ [Thermosediminibacter oceani DSM 16646]
MTQETVIYLAREALSMVILVSAPMLGIGMLVGLLISIFQATTQIQEQSLTFVPKIVVVMMAILIFGPWMLNLMVNFTETLFREMPNFIH